MNVYTFLFWRVGDASKNIFDVERHMINENLGETKIWHEKKVMVKAPDIYIRAENRGCADTDEVKFFFYMDETNLNE